MTADLAAYLRARWDEEAALAEAASPGPWHVNAESDEVLAVDGITVADGFALSGSQLRATTEHIALHDPAHVLADIAADRALLAEWEKAKREADGIKFDPQISAFFEGQADGLYRAIQLRAARFRGRDDFNPAWLEG